MKESVGYNVTINMIIVFITIVFFFLIASMIYFKSNKVNNYITHSIEKYEGYNSLAQNEIEKGLTTIGYNKSSINCENTKDDCPLIEEASGTSGYCIYYCNVSSSKHQYYYIVRTNMFLNIPIINNILNLPIYSNTDELINMEEILLEES